MRNETKMIANFPPTTERNAEVNVRFTCGWPVVGERRPPTGGIDPTRPVASRDRYRPATYSYAGVNGDSFGVGPTTRGIPDLVSDDAGPAPSVRCLGTTRARTIIPRSAAGAFRGRGRRVRRDRAGCGCAVLERRAVFLRSPCYSAWIGGLSSPVAVNGVVVGHAANPNQ